MSLGVGQSSAALARLDTFAVRVNARTGEGQLFEQARQRRAEQEIQVRVGFSKDALSSQGAALETVSTNLERARAAVPSVEQLREQAEEAAIEAARQEATQPQSGQPQSEQPQPETQAPAVSAKPKAEPFARFFLQDSGQPGSVPDAAGTAKGVVEVQPSASSDSQGQAEPVDQRDGATALLNLLA